MIKFYLKAINKEVKNNYQSITFNILISLFCLLPLFYISNYKQQLFVTITCAIILLLVSFINRIIFVILSVSSLLLSVVITHIVILWGKESLESRVQAAYLSPTYESMEYVQSYFTMIDYLLASYVFLFSLACIAYLYKVKLKFLYMNRLSCCILLVVILLSQKIVFFYDVQPFGFIHAISKAGEWKSVVNNRLSYLAKRKPQINQVSPYMEYDKIVLLLGESVNRDHMSVYGYGIKTTPFLDNLLTKKNSYKFNNAISPSNQTRFAVPMLLTNAHVTNFELFTSSASVLSEFNDFEYKTYWLSNQYTAGQNDSYIASIASEANVTKIANFVYQQGGFGDSSYDQILLDYLNLIKIDPISKEFYVLHMLGSHFQYSKRYPKGDGVFPQPKSKVEEYDNSIKYSDDILNQVINIFKNSKTLFIYVSDHGEVVGSEKSGHGYINPSYSDEYHVPFIVYSTVDNERLNQFHRDNKDTLINLEVLNQLIMYFSTGSSITHPISNNQVITLEPINVINYNSLSSYDSFELKN